jgi:hypothetical protein
MAAIHIQTWSIDPSLSGVADIQVRQAYWNNRGVGVINAIETHIQSLVAAGLTVEANKTILFNRNSGIMVRVREFLNITAADDNILWYDANVPGQVVDNGQVVFTLVSHTSQDNMTLSQYEAAWVPN